MVLPLKVKECYLKTMNFILKYTGTEHPDLEKMTATLAQHQARVLDDSLLPKTALIRLEESKLNQIKGDLDQGWEIIPEKTYQVPTTKKTIKRS